MNAMPVGYPSALEAAQRLRDALTRYDITAIINGDHDLAVVSVCAGLTVWCNGERFWWYAGWDDQRRCRVNASQEVGALDRAAERISDHHAQLRRPSSGSPYSGGAPV
ncbi:hypothetical protein AB0D67_24945 [Streptosporangium sp. NPDC048047]|uniref:hypothetical protein n=1 Tax=Streptosporangium sp. NPDC048047 TaxID=3155748 RepID=UPI0034418374